jgi:Arc/MetJ-type ribon-helix-helix transcriptional regulator
MTINLPDEQIQWLEAQVVAGHFPNLQAAVEAAVVALMLDEPDDDLSWVKPRLDAAERSLNSQGGVSLDAVLADLDEFIAKRRRS